jgi:hypothetical protein
MATAILAVLIAFVVVATALLLLAPIAEWRQRHRLAPSGEIPFKAPKWLGDVGSRPLAWRCSAFIAVLALLSVINIGG